jgi:hypothetical protein
MVTLSPKTKVTLIYKDMKSNWIKIKVSNQEGWIQDYVNGVDYHDQKIHKIGCQAAG